MVLRNQRSSSHNGEPFLNQVMTKVVTSAFRRKLRGHWCKAWHFMPQVTVFLKLEEGFDLIVALGHIILNQRSLNFSDSENALAFLGSLLGDLQVRDFSESSVLSSLGTDPLFIQSTGNESEKWKRSLFSSWTTCKGTSSLLLYIFIRHSAPLKMYATGHLMLHMLHITVLAFGLY